jgi:thiamine biosynthesis lipoprotein
MVVNSHPVLERIRNSVQETVGPAGRKVAFQAMGTRCHLIFTTASREAGDFFIAETLNWLAEFEARYSRFLPDSLISRINAAAGKSWVPVDAETENLLGMCHQLHFITRGAFDAASLPLLRLWNWKAERPRIPTLAEIEAARAISGWARVQRRPGEVFLPLDGMCLDFGGVGKEYAVDQVVQMAGEHGISSLLVDFGQDLRVVGLPSDKPAWHIGLEDPRQPGTIWASLAVRERAVATSGDYLRSFTHEGRRFGHIIDPRTGWPVDNGCLAVSVIAPSCSVAGALSTTAFILGPQEGLRLIESYFGAAGCITTSTSRLYTRNIYEYLIV